MKLKNDQSGLAHVVTIALVVLVIGVVGFAGWRVWDSKNNSKLATTQKTSKIDRTNCTEGYKLETNSEMNIHFCRPANWTYDYRVHNDIQTKLIYLISPDHKNAASGGTDSGSKVTITTHKVDAYHPTSKEILTQKYKSFSKIAAVKIADRNGASYISDSGDSPAMYNQFEENNIIYLISLDKDVSGSTFNDNLDKFQKIIETFDLIN